MDAQLKFNGKPKKLFFNIGGPKFMSFKGFTAK